MNKLPGPSHPYIFLVKKYAIRYGSIKRNARKTPQAI